jgi:hypothetical protein
LEEFSLPDRVVETDVDVRETQDDLRVLGENTAELRRHL